MSVWFLADLCMLCCFSGVTGWGVPRLQAYMRMMLYVARAKMDPMKCKAQGFTAFMLIMLVHIFLSELVALERMEVVALAIVPSGEDYVSLVFKPFCDLSTNIVHSDLHPRIAKSLRLCVCAGENS